MDDFLAMTGLMLAVGSSVENPAPAPDFNIRPALLSLRYAPHPSTHCDFRKVSDFF
jgi:hypothetical protein